MVRGNNQDGRIFGDNQDRLCFLDTLEKVALAWWVRERMAVPFLSINPQRLLARLRGRLDARMHQHVAIRVRRLLAGRERTVSDHRWHGLDYIHQRPASRQPVLPAAQTLDSAAAN